MTSPSRWIKSDRSARSSSQLFSGGHGKNSQKFQSWAMPGDGEIVRNMSVIANGNVALADSLANEVGLGEIK
jgi:hypothetical protein